MNHTIWCVAAHNPCSNSGKSEKIAYLQVLLQPYHGAPNPCIRLAKPLVWLIIHPTAIIILIFTTERGLRTMFSGDLSYPCYLQSTLYIYRSNVATPCISVISGRE
ncbi:hypothetical protein TNCV_2035681 [Trichonephila clavipes]|nr:hypothetical protein TNCV_2035681 [Trichonephila clavipes]